MIRRVFVLVALLILLSAAKSCSSPPQDPSNRAESAAGGGGGGSIKDPATRSSEQICKTPGSSRQAYLEQVTVTWADTTKYPYQFSGAAKVRTIRVVQRTWLGNDLAGRVSFEAQGRVKGGTVKYGQVLGVSGPDYTVNLPDTGSPRIVVPYHRHDPGFLRVTIGPVGGASCAMEIKLKPAG